MTDPIADMLTRIRNALAVGKDEVVLPMSKIKFNIAKLLEREGWIVKAEVIKGGLQTKRGSRFDQLRIVLKYDKAGKPAIRALKRVSKPGLRVYVTKDKIPYVLQGYGIAIISTSQGLLTNKEAKKRGIGGEVLCEIW
jgi:small subunit ribosomal protein S8